MLKGKTQHKMASKACKKVHMDRCTDADRGACSYGDARADRCSDVDRGASADSVQVQREV